MLSREYVVFIISDGNKRNFVLVTVCCLVSLAFGCASSPQKSIYYSPSLSGNFRLENVQFIKGESCYYDEPKNAFITPFINGVSMEGAVVPIVDTDPQGREIEKSTALLLWFFSTAPLAYDRAVLQIAINGKPHKNETPLVNTRTDYPKKIAPRDYVYARRSYLAGVGPLSRQELFHDLKIIRPNEVRVRPPVMIVGGEKVQMPEITFVLISGEKAGFSCGFQ